MPLKQAIEDLDTKLATMGQIQTTQGQSLASLLAKLNEIDERTEKIDQQTAPKVKAWDEKTLNAVESIDKAVKLGKKFFQLLDGGCKVCTTIINNVEGMSMELITQSTPELHDGVSGKFVTAPDAFIPPQGATSIVSEKRKKSMAGNVNGVIYLASIQSVSYHIGVSWSHPYSGKSHYFLKVEKVTAENDGKEGFKTFLEGVNNSMYNSLRYCPEQGELMNEIEIEAVGTYSDGFLRVVIQPRSQN